jgi:LmbE family N-acetylglucosaminyl deacetylase
MNYIKSLLLLLLITNTVFAQTAPPADLATIEQNFKKLETLGSVLYVAAHPDDENTRLLAYLAQEKHYRTGYLSLTRGDGGQNLLGNEQGELLGLIRTQELLAARRVDGAEQFFTRANDFGFSKGPDETLKIWDKEKVLSDVVWVIRKFRPDVIICRFPTTGEGGHGHHTSSAILAQEAFSAAADPSRFPEQLQYVKTWQAKRQLWNTFSFGTVNTTAPDQFKIDVGVYNPVLGKGYGEMAAESRSNHKTQGFGSAKQRGESFEYFKTILGDAPKTDLMDGVNTTWARVEGGIGLATEIESIRTGFNMEHPDRSVPELVTLLEKVEKIQDLYWQEQKTKELDDLIAACAGLWFEAYAAAPYYALGETIPIRAEIVCRYNANVKLGVIMSDAFDSEAPNDSSSEKDKSVEKTVYKQLHETPLSVNQLQTFNLKTVSYHISQPYWLEQAHSIGSYVIDNQQFVGSPENPDIPKVTFAFTINAKPIHFERRLIYKYVDPVRGEVYQPLAITPPVTANIASQTYIFNSATPQSVQVKLKAFKKITDGGVKIDLPTGWKAQSQSIAFHNKAKGDEWTETFMVSPGDNQTQNGVLSIGMFADADRTLYDYGFKQIKYDHVPVITLFPPAQTRLLNVNLKLAGKKIGYIPGAGDLMQDALKQVGYDVHQLSENEILNGDLSTYDAIVTGVRAYNVNDRLAFEQPKLLEYVKNGGNLVVQYNNNNGLVTKQIGPYPFRPVNQRVTDENAKITILDKGNPVLNYPNVINEDDFNGWVQERGLYFVGEIDPSYKAPLQMNDPGEAANNGALIIGNYGSGRFVYTSLAFFRQLPAGVPGAYRLFVNLLSKPKNLVP